MPSPRVVFALALAVLATGFALGAAAGPSAPYAVAGSAGATDPIVIVWPQVPASAAPLAPPAPAPEPAAAPAAPAAEPELPEAPVLPAAPATPPAAAPEAEPEPEPQDEEPATGTQPGPAPVKHVWMIVLTGHGLEDGFGPASQSLLLRETMPRKGLLLLDHHSVSPDPLANGLALITGQAQAGSLPEQLTGEALTWKAYVESAPGCQPPAPRNPFAHVPALAADCGTQVVGLDQLAPDLATADTIPSFSYIVPDACHDGSDTPCAPGMPAGTAATNPWIADVLRKIRATRTYKKDGLVIVTFDHGGDGKVGALLLSPFLSAGTTQDTRTDHYSLLKLVEDLFGLEHLGRAAQTQDVHWSATTR